MYVGVVTNQAEGRLWNAYLSYMPVQESASLQVGPNYNIPRLGLRSDSKQHAGVFDMNITVSLVDGVNRYFIWHTLKRTVERKTGVESPSGRDVETSYPTLLIRF